MFTSEGNYLNERAVVLVLGTDAQWNIQFATEGSTGGQANLQIARGKDADLESRLLQHGFWAASPTDALLNSNGTARTLLLNLSHIWRLEKLANGRLSVSMPYRQISLAEGESLQERFKE